MSIQNITLWDVKIYILRGARSLRSLAYFSTVDIWSFALPPPPPQKKNFSSLCHCMIERYKPHMGDYFSTTKFDICCTIKLRFSFVCINVSRFIGRRCWIKDVQHAVVFREHCPHIFRPIFNIRPMVKLDSWNNTSSSYSHIRVPVGTTRIKSCCPKKLVALGRKLAVFARTLALENLRGRGCSQPAPPPPPTTTDS